MFGFLNVVHAYFLYHNYTGKYLGFKYEKDCYCTVIVPINIKEKAVDFKIKQAYFNFPNKTSNMNIYAPNNEIWNTKIFRKKGETLTLVPFYKSEHQYLKIAMLSHKKFIVYLHDMCLNYDEDKNRFISGKCEDQYKSFFEIHESYCSK